MFGIGFQEMLIILVVVLIFFGPKRLPDLAKSLGKGIAEFKKASEEVRKGIEDAVKEESTEGATKPPEDLSAYGKAPGSAPAPGEPAPHISPPPGMVITPVSGATPDNAPVPVEPPPSTGTPVPVKEAAPGTASGETPVPPPRQG
jgi:TatA/E family protein of Tat protein translocase